MTTEASVTGKQSVLAKLQTARIRLQEMKLKKSGHNKFAGYDYFELGDFLPTINKLFHELGLCSSVSFFENHATLTITDIDRFGSDNCSIVFASPMAEAQLKGCHPIQNLGATQTYLRRYLYVTALEIVEHDALDASEPIKPEIKAGVGVHKATDGAGDSLSTDQKTAMKDLAAWITKGLAEFGAEEAFARYDNELEQDEKIYLWDLLDSKVRSAIKKVGQTKTITPLHS